MSPKSKLAYNKYADSAILNQRPREFEVIDKIFQQELTEVETQVKDDTAKKIKKMNAGIDERIK